MFEKYLILIHVYQYEYNGFELGLPGLLRNRKVSKAVYKVLCMRNADCIKACKNQLNKTILTHGMLGNISADDIYEIFFNFFTRK